MPSESGIHLETCFCFGPLPRLSTGLAQLLAYSSMNPNRCWAPFMLPFLSALPAFCPLWPSVLPFGQPCLLIPPFGPTGGVLAHQPCLSGFSVFRSCLSILPFGPSGGVLTHEPCLSGTSVFQSCLSILPFCSYRRLSCP